MEDNINPFALQVSPTPSIIPEFDITKRGQVSNKIDNYNPFDKLVKKQESLPDIDSLINEFDKPKVAPLTVSTYGVQNYLKRGYQLTDLDLGNPNLEQDLSSTQGSGERFANNLKVAGANFASMAVSTFLTTPADLIDVIRFDSKGNIKANSEPLTEPSLSKSIYDWGQDVAEQNRNFETRDDKSDGIWDNITNWINPTANSTKGIGKILESTAFGLGAGLGIAGQEALITLATEGIGTVPALAAWIQRGLNSGKYLEKALKVSRIAEEGANSLSKIVKAGEITNGVARGLKTVYQSQLGSYSEALFEGLEGKESLKKQLISDFEKIHGFTPDGDELAKIEQTSTDAGIARMNINRALLTVTNFSQYNSIFKSFDAARQGAEAAAEKYGSKIIYENGKAVVSGNKALPKWFDTGIGKYIKPLAQAGANMKSGDIVKEALQEGMEEGLQFFTDKALNNYYTWKHYGDNKTVGNALQAATDELFKKEGLESIFTGMLAGGGQTAVTNFLSNLNPEYKASKKQYETLQAQYAETYNELDEKIKNIPEQYRGLPNSIKQKLYNVYNNDSVRGTVVDKVQQANASNGLLGIKNAPADEEQYNQALTHEMFNIAIPYAKNGNIDILLEQFKDFKNKDNKDFQLMFGLTEEEAKNKDQIIDLYLEEFNKIQTSFKRVDNAFQRPKNANISNNVYNTLKSELAFSFYNNDRLTQTAKELEQGIGSDYIDMLSGIITSPNRRVNKNKIVAKNKAEINRINGLGDIASKEEKNRAKGLEQMNDFLNKMSASTTAIDVKKAIYSNLVKPYQDEKGISNNYDLEEKLNKVYYLNKVKDRLKDNQDKIDAILFSNNPEEYIQQKEQEFILEQRKIQAKKIKEQIEKQVEEDKKVAEEKPKQPVPEALQSDEQKDVVFDDNITDLEYSTFIDKGIVNKSILDKIANKVKNNIKLSPRELEIFTDKTKEINEILASKLYSPEIETGDEQEEYNNIESKDHELVYITDEDGNIVDIESDEAKYRARKLAQVVNGFESMSDFKDKLELSVWNNKQQLPGIAFPDEVFLYKKAPVSGVNVLYENGSMGIIPLDRELYVDADRFENITGLKTVSEPLEIKNQGIKNVINYSEFLNILENNPEANTKVREAGFILNIKGRISPSVADLKKNHNLYINFSKYIKDNIKNINNEKIRKSILDQLDVLAFISDRKLVKEDKYKDTGEIKTRALIPLTDLIGDKIPPIIKVDYIKGKYYFTAINHASVDSRFEPKFLNSYNKEQWEENESKTFTFLVNHNTKHVSEDTIHIVSASQRPLKEYTAELTKTFDSNDKLLTYLKEKSAGVVSEFDKGDNIKASMNFENSKEGNMLQVNIEYSDENNAKLPEKDTVKIDYSELTNKSLLEITNIIKAKVLSEKKIKFDFYKSAQTIEGSYTDYSAILVNNYFSRNNFQVYSTLMLKINPNEQQVNEPVIKQSEPVVETVEETENNINLNLAKKIKAIFTGQGTIVQFEITGKSGKEFLLTVNRKREIDLYDTKKIYSEDDIRFTPSGKASQKQVNDLYNEYIDKDIQEAINNWINSITGSWAAANTNDGKNYKLNEKKLINKLNNITEKYKTDEDKLIENNIFVKKLKNVIELYKNKSFIFKVNQSGKDGLYFLTWEVSGENILSEHLEFFKDKFKGELFDWLNRVYKELTGKTFEEHDAELKALETEDNINQQDEENNKILEQFRKEQTINNDLFETPKPVDNQEVNTVSSNNSSNKKEQFINKIIEDLKSIGFAFSNVDVITPTGVNKGTFLNILNGMEESKILERIEKIQVDSKPLYISGKINNSISSITSINIPPQLVRIGASTRVENNNKQVIKTLINNCL